MWVSFKGIMLNKRGQSQKFTFHLIPFVYHSHKGKTIMTETRSMVARD